MCISITSNEYFLQHDFYFVHYVFFFWVAFMLFSFKRNQIIKQTMGNFPGKMFKNPNPTLQRVNTWIFAFLSIFV